MELSSLNAQSIAGKTAKNASLLAIKWLGRNISVIVMTSLFCLAVYRLTKINRILQSRVLALETSVKAQENKIEEHIKSRPPLNLFKKDGTEVSVDTLASQEDLKKLEENVSKIMTTLNKNVHELSNEIKKPENLGSKKHRRGLSEMSEVVFEEESDVESSPFVTPEKPDSKAKKLPTVQEVD